MVMSQVIRYAIFINFIQILPSLIALTDGSGTIFSKEGLDLRVLADLFHQRQSELLIIQ